MSRLWRLLPLLWLLTAAGAEPPLRLLVTATPATAILLKLGAGDAIAAIDEYNRIVPGAEQLYALGVPGAISLEKLAELRITHALLWDYQRTLAAGCRTLGIEVLPLAPPNLKTYPELIRQLGQLTGREARAAELCREFERELAALPEPAPDARRVRVYLELYRPYQTVGPDSYLHELLVRAGAENLGAELRAGNRINPEQLLAAPPDVIFYLEGYTDPEELRRRPGFAALPAVRNHRLYPLPRGRLIAGLEPAQLIALFQSYLNGVK